MVQDKDTESTEIEEYKNEAQHRLELVKADEKRIKEEIETLKKEIERAKESEEGKVIDVQWAEEEIADCRLLEEVVARKKERLEIIINSGSREELPELIDFSSKQKVYVDKEKNKNDEKSEEKTEEEKTENKTPNEDNQLKMSPEEIAVGMVSFGVASARKRSENVKLKEVARGVNAVSAIQAEKNSRVQINNRGKEVSLAGTGLSREAEKRLKKEERRQEQTFKKIQKENEKGVTGVRTESNFVTKDGEKVDKNRIVLQNTAGENKKKSDELRRAVLERKIEKLRDKLESLQQQRVQQHKEIVADNADKIRFSEQEAKALPSVKAGRAVGEAYKAKNLPLAEKGGAVNEGSLMKMEIATEKATESVKTAKLVPDYATPEFKRKAAEQGIDLNKNESSKEKDKKRSDRRKLLALSGRSAEEDVSINEEKTTEKEHRYDREELRIDPEKSRSIDENKSGKEINMQQYQQLKKLRSGRLAG